MRNSADYVRNYFAPPHYVLYYGHFFLGDDVYIVYDLPRGQSISEENLTASGK